MDKTIQLLNQIQSHTICQLEVNEENEDFEINLPVKTDAELSELESKLQNSEIFTKCVVP